MVLSVVVGIMLWVGGCMVCVLVSRYMEVIELMQEELVLRMDLFRRIEKALVFMKEKVMRSAIDDVHDAEAKAGGGGQGGGGGRGGESVHPTSK